MEETMDEHHSCAGTAARPGAIDRRQLLISTAAASVMVGMVPDAVRAKTASTAPVKGVTGTFQARKLLKADLTKLLDFKNQSKPVRGRLLVDAMDDPKAWFASDVVSLKPTSNSKSGKGALRFETKLRDEAYIAASRSKNGSFTGQAILFAGQPFSAFVAKRFATAQDWSAYNRMSLWCYVHPTRNPVNSISLQFICDGATAGPADPVSVHYFADLKAGDWNYLVWEFPEIRRDKVSQIVIFQPLAGLSEAAATPEIAYDLDSIWVEAVDAERVDGWSVIPGKLAYSHLGYLPTAEKVAVAGDGPATFEIIETTTKVVTELPATSMSSRNIDYKLLDFSSISKPGTYQLKHGSSVSEPFPITGNAWRPLVGATLNAFYGFRCGFAVENSHDACHLDVFAEYNGKKRSIGGGWHDAANLTQGPYRTHLSIYALTNLHDSLIRQGEIALAKQALEEARWGLEWSLKCRFGPGLRALYVDTSYWTDSKAGTADDVVQEDERSAVGRDSYQNTLAALASARAARALVVSNPSLARTLTTNAREDYADVVANFKVPTDAPPREINDPSWRDEVGYLTLTAVELYRTTTDVQYQTDAVKWAKLLQDLQERRFVDGIPLTGYFYEDSGRTRIVHEYHNSFEDCALLSFAALCETFPDHPEWMDWYAGLAIYADYFCNRGSIASKPFSVVPAAVWRKTDLDAPLPPDQTGMRLAKMGPTPVFPTAPTDALIRDQMMEMFEAGTDLGNDYRLRVFPLWSDHIRHGATTVHMSKTIGLGAAAQVLGRSDLSELTSRQVQWVIGANPLSRSLIYGVGNDFWQNFTSEMPNLVGGMSLGFNSYRDDSPAWGNNAVFPYKEQWIYSSCRIAMNLTRIGVPSRVRGRAPAGASFTNTRTHEVTKVRPGNYDVALAAGKYEVHFADQVKSVELAHAADRRIDLDPKKFLSAKLVLVDEGEAGARLKLLLTGIGEHQLAVRSFNAKTSEVPTTVHLQAGHPSEFEVKVELVDGEKPWLVRIKSGNNLSESWSLMGTSTRVQKMA
jgi:hypothetical protein